MRHLIRLPGITALALASTLAASGLAYAQSAPVTPVSPHEGRYRERMNLTAEQRTAIREVHGRRAAEYKQLHQSLRKAQGELRQLALNGGDEAAIKAKSAEVAALLAQRVELRTTTLQEIAPILTPEQREQMAQGGSRGHWRRHGPPPTHGS
jgi:Spy/CpxP family protein refolding chaperone